MEMTTAYMVAERRIMEAFASEMEALGLKADTSGISGSYRADGVFVAQLQTKPEPVKGSKAKMEALRAAGYFVDVYAPYDWNHRRAFVVRVSRPVIITDADREVAGYGDYAAFEIHTRNIVKGRVVDGFFVRGQRCSDNNWPLLAECESLEAAKTFIRGIRIDAIRQPVYGPDGYCMNV